MNIFRKNKFSKYLKNSIYIHPDSEIGGNTSIGFGTNITGPAIITSGKNNPVTIGKYCAIADGLRILTQNHYTGYANLQVKFQNQYNFPDIVHVKGPVTIGNNVWIAAHVTILSGVTIGNGAVVGANSLVTKDIEPYTIVGGSPAKELRKRFEQNIILQLQDIKWWEWSEDKIRRNKKFFEIDFSKKPDLDLQKLICD